MTLSFDGHNLESLFVCGSPELAILNSQFETRELPSRDGAAVTDSRFGCSQVSLSLFTEGTAQERRAAFSTLGSWLNVSEPKRLVLPDTPDRYYLAIPDGSVDIERCLGSEIASISFLITDPAAYGETKTATIPSGGHVSIQVGGTYPATCEVKTTAASRNTDGMWGVALDTGEFMHVYIGATTKTVQFLCGQRKCLTTANRVESMMTLLSDWFTLEPGNHVVTMDRGTGEATITWTERWL